MSMSDHGTGHRGRTKKYFIFLLAGVFSQASPAFAAALKADSEATSNAGANSDGDGDGDGDIVVTAERKQGSLQTTPAAITVLQGDQFKRDILQYIGDLTTRVPGVFISRVNPSNSIAVIAIRGIQGSPFDSPGVGVYIDDVYIPRGIGSFVEFNNVDRVEVLKGPQGTLYGRNSIGGALKIITRDPGDELHLYGEIGVGSYNTRLVKAGLSGPLSDKLAASIDFVHRERDGYIYNVTLGKSVMNVDASALRFKLKYTATDALNFTFIADGAIDNSGSSSYTPLSQPGGGFNPYHTFSDLETGVRLRQGGLALKAAWQLSEQTELRSVTSYRSFRMPSVNDLAGVDTRVPTNSTIYGNLLNEEHNFTQELLLSGAFGKSIQYTAGFFYFREDYVYSSRPFHSNLNLDTFQLKTTFFNRDHETVNAFAFFGQADVELFEGLKLTGGLRYSKENRNFDYDYSSVTTTVFGPVGSSTPTAFSLSEKRTWDNLSPKVALQYQLNQNVFAYASLSKGFKAGGFNQGSTFEAARVAYNPETLVAYEAGIKLSFAKKAGRLNVAAYHSDYDNMQVTSSDPNNNNVITQFNAGKGYIRGIEAEFSYSPLRGLQLNANGAAAEGEITSFTGPAAFGKVGNPLPGLAKWTLSGGIDYVLPVSLPGEIALSTDLQYHSRVYEDLTANLAVAIPSETTWNGGIRYTTQDMRWTASFNVSNILNKIYYSFPNSAPSIGLNSRVYAAPRTVLGRLSYQF